MEVEKTYLKEIDRLKGEIDKWKEDNQYKSMFNQVNENLATYTQRKISQKEKTFKPISKNGTPISLNYDSHKNFKLQKKVMSIWSSTNWGKISFPDSKTSKKKIKKIKKDIQKNLLKGYLLGKTEGCSEYELSTRTPDKTHTELSPYMMNFYQKHSVLYNENPSACLRSNGNSLQYLQSKIQGKDVKTTHRSMVDGHKKSKSHSSMLGMKSMDQRKSHPSLPIEDKAPEPDKKYIKKKIEFTINVSDLVPTHKRHLTDPKVSVVSIPKNQYNTYHSKKIK